jgi:hypothetical protein
LDMPLTEIQTVQHKTGLMFGELLVTTAGGSKKIEQLWKKGTQHFAEIVSGLIYAAHAPAKSVAASPPSSATSEDTISRLERLAKLRESGVLTEEEFQSEKRKILGL